MEPVTFAYDAEDYCLLLGLAKDPTTEDDQPWIAHVAAVKTVGFQTTGLKRYVWILHAKYPAFPPIAVNAHIPNDNVRTMKKRADDAFSRKFRELKVPSISKFEDRVLDALCSDAVKAYFVRQLEGALRDVAVNAYEEAVSGSDCECDIDGLRMDAEAAASRFHAAMKAEKDAKAAAEKPRDAQQNQQQNQQPARQQPAALAELAEQPQQQNQQPAPQQPAPQQPAPQQPADMHANAEMHANQQMHARLSQAEAEAERERTLRERTEAERDHLAGIG